MIDNEEELKYSVITEQGDYGLGAKEVSKEEQKKVEEQIKKQHDHH